MSVKLNNKISKAFDSANKKALPRFPKTIGVKIDKRREVVL